MTQLPPIVGIGASAGGLEALEAFVAAIPNDSGIAYVVVQHLAPDQPSLMASLLGAHTPVPVDRIEDGGAIEPDHIYVIPPGPFLSIEDGRFRLTRHDREQGVRTPIDRFFGSLAQTAGRNAFAVVLSGTGSDGTAGVRAIKSQGGVVLVQDSRSARFSGMPDSATATGLVDHVLRPRDMAGRILEIVRHRQRIDEKLGRDELLRQIEDRLGEILEALQEGTPHSFSGYKPGTLVRRVARRMTLLRQSQVSGYLQTLADNPEERQLLARDFLIGVTQFFRNPEGFDALRERVLRPLLEREQAGYRIWVPGCSTGEEVYSLAILIGELMEETGDRRQWKIFGTDIDTDALRFARIGRFPEAVAEDLGAERRERFFVRETGFLQVVSHLRDMCVFAPHNLLQDPPFSRLDLISCRNVMIYLNADSQEAVLPRFHYALRPSSFLWLGSAESLGRSERYFQTVHRGAKIFRRDDATPPGFTTVASPPQPAPRRSRRAPSGAPVARAWGSERRGADIETRSERIFLQRLAAPFVTVDRQDAVVYVSEAMTAFVKPSRGAPSSALDDYLTQELRLPVQAALREARESGIPAEARNVVVRLDGVERLYDIDVEPFGDESGLMLVALTEVRHRDTGPAPDAEEGARRDAGYEQELRLTRKRLVAVERGYESAEQDLRSANEELLSMNEELQSSNEELETSREELQSINEELETINAELSENNRQLTRANSDLKNLLESTDIATLFIDQTDCVRLFTPELARLFGVQERDIGRSIHDLASRIDHPRLQADAEEVRRTLQPIEREVRIEATDETFAMRIRPYRTVDDRLDGAVITFVDVTGRKRNERQLEENARALAEQYAELETLYGTAPIGLNLLDRDLRYLRINETLAAINGYSVADHIGRRQEELLPEAHAHVAETQARVFATGEPALGLVVRTETPADPGRIREFVVDHYPVKDGAEVFAVGTCVREITKERELERRIKESAVRQRVAVEAAGLGVFEWQFDQDRALWENDRMFEIFGRDREAGPLSFREFNERVLHPDDLDRLNREIEQGKTTGTLNTVVRIRRLSDGAIRHIEYFGRIENGADPEAGRMIGVVADVTAQTLALQREREQQGRLQRLQDSLSAFVGLLDAEGTLIEANATAIERGGVSREEVIGRKFWDCWWWSFSEESRDRLRDAVARAAAGETLRYDVPARMAKGEMIVIDFQLVPSLDAEGRVIEIVPSGVDVTERVRAEERKDILLAELEHRVKNTLATVQSIARLTARMAPTREAIAQSLVDRLQAMSRTHDALTARDWEGQSLRVLVESEIAPYVAPGDGRFAYRGDDLELKPRTVLSLGLALHELATNAAKYGAFSNEAGRVAFTATQREDGLFRLEWRETGGPAVAPPERRGFGTFLIQSLLERELDASIQLLYETDGVRCVIETGKDHLS